MKQESRDWIERADAELETLGILMRGSFPVGALGLCLFITHHVVELGYKALYCENGVRPPKTHDLLRLHAEVLGAGWNLIIDPMDVALLNQYGVDARYPGFIIASITEVKDAQTASKRIYEAIRLELDKRP